MTSISVEHISKSYQIFHKRKRPDTFRELLAGVFRKSDAKRRGNHLKTETFYALRDVSFEVNQGDVLGIIGRNGAGKSTLLKVLSRITEPTSGRIKINGRVASLLEVGTGFHPELSGRENIFLNGAILGMSRKEIKRKFDEIVSFSGVEKFIDTPVKRYSSGMYVRLAFSVASHLEPEILIVDEVLAVGDRIFQQKCLGKMEDVSKDGRTVLFVSHSMPSIQNLCTSCALIEDGSITKVGSPSSVIKHYTEESPDAKEIKGQVIESDPNFIIDRIEINGSAQGLLTSGNPFECSLFYHCPNPEKYQLGLEVSFTFNLNQEKIVNLWSAYSPKRKIIPTAQGRICCSLPQWPFRDGTFSLDVYVNDLAGSAIAWVKNTKQIHSQDGDFYNTGKLANSGEGIMFLPQDWHHDSL